MRWMAVALLASACTSAADPCEDGTPGTVCRVAGVGEHAYNGDGRSSLETAFYLPSQVRRGPDGLLYVMDFNNMRLRRIEDDGTVKTIAGAGQHAGAIVGAPALESSLENPIDFDFLPDGRIVFISFHDPRVLMIDHDGTLQLVAGGLPGQIGNEGDGGLATYARFVEPSGLTISPDGAIYIADGTANRVRVIRDGIINTVAGTGIAGFEGDGADASRARLNNPTALALDGEGNLYVSDTGNCAVRKITPTATISSVAGSGYRGFAGDGGPAWAAALAHPQGVAVADDGTLFVGDRFNNRIRKVAPDGTISTIAGTGEGGLTGDGGPAIDASFGYIGRVQIDVDGSLLVSDQTNSTIRKIFAPF